MLFLKNEKAFFICDTKGTGDCYDMWVLEEKIMKETKLEIIRLDNDDVIATSGKIVVKGNLEGCYYFTGQQETWLQGKNSTDGINVVNKNSLMRLSFSTALKNAYGDNSTIEYNTWYAMYADGPDRYLYKHSDTDLSDHTHSATD